MPVLVEISSGQIYDSHTRTGLESTRPSRPTGSIGFVFGLDSGHSAELGAVDSVADECHKRDDESTDSWNPLQPDEEKEENRNQNLGEEPLTERSVEPEGCNEPQTVVNDAGNQPDHGDEAKRENRCPERLGGVSGFDGDSRERTAGQPSVRGRRRHIFASLHVR